LFSKLALENFSMYALRSVECLDLSLHSFAISNVWSFHISPSNLSMIYNSRMWCRI